MLLGRKGCLPSLPGRIGGVRNKHLLHFLNPGFQLCCKSRGGVFDFFISTTSIPLKYALKASHCIP